MEGGVSAILESTISLYSSVHLPYILIFQLFYNWNKMLDISIYTLYKLSAFSSPTDHFLNPVCKILVFPQKEPLARLQKYIGLKISKLTSAPQVFSVRNNSLYEALVKVYSFHLQRLYVGISLLCGSQHLSSFNQRFERLCSNPDKVREARHMPLKNSLSSHFLVSLAKFPPSESCMGNFDELNFFADVLCFYFGHSRLQRES